MNTKAREFIDFWVESSVHAVEQFRTSGAPQDVEELAQRCVEMAKSQGITEEALREEIGDYVRDRLKAANAAEFDRHK